MTRARVGIGMRRERQRDGEMERWSGRVEGSEKHVLSCMGRPQCGCERQERGLTAGGDWPI